MNRYLLTSIGAAALAATLALAADDQTPTPLALGAAPPMADVKMMSVAGNEISLADAKGPKGTLVIFTCNHCPFVKAWEERTVALGNAALASGVGVIAVNSNDPAVNDGDSLEGMKARATERGMKYPYVVDATSDLARAFGATKTPEFFLFDAAGKLVYHGALDDNSREPEKVTAKWLADAVEAVQAGKDVAVKETKALGCSIKFRKRA